MIDLMHYVHKGGEDSSLPNHRPLTLVHVLRKVFSAVSTSRMRRDWTRLRILDTCNPGFEPGRSTVNVIYPLRMAAEQCLAGEEELVAFLDDLKWCFDMPAQVVIELALHRLAVPDFYHNMLDDIDIHTAKTTIAAHHGRSVAGSIRRWHPPSRARDGPGHHRLTAEVDSGGRHGHLGRESR